MSVRGDRGGGNGRCVYKQWAGWEFFFSILLVVAWGCLFSRAEAIYWRRCPPCRRVYTVPVQRHSGWTLTKTSWGGFPWPLPGKITGSDPNQGRWELPELKLDHVQVRQILSVLIGSFPIVALMWNIQHASIVSRKFSDPTSSMVWWVLLDLWLGISA